MAGSLRQQVIKHWYQRPVAWAFMFLFMLIGLISLVSIGSLERIESEYLQSTQVHVDKLRLLDEMVHYSRQRSVLLRDIVIAEDSFLQDEFIQKHGVLATRYLLARNTLNEKVAPGKEKQLIDEIIRLNRLGYDVQQQILSYAIDGEKDKALSLVANSLGPNREKIYPAMLEMKEILVNASNQAAFNAKATMDNTRQVVIWLSVCALVLGLLIAWVAYRLERNKLIQLDWQGTHDELTGLLNRFEFENQLAGAVDSSVFTGDKGVTLFYIDMDQFNLVNNISGHQAGDELLRQIAYVLTQSIPVEHTIARIGGDQFAVLLLGLHVDQAIELAHRTLKKINELQFMWLDRAYQVSASLGVVSIDAREVDKGEILSVAYLACDLAKDGGGNRVEVYQKQKPDTQERRKQLDWASRLKQAMADKKLVLFRQGIKSPAGNLKHSEILLRMESENGDMVTAGQFIPAAERFKIIVDVDLYVIRNMLEYLKNNDSDRNSYAINLSGISMSHKSFANEVISLIDATGVDPGKICFEITETAAITNKTTAIRFMNILHGFGCHFFLDDFGSGLSSFGYLRNLPIDLVKIDGHFVRNMEMDIANLSVISAVNTIAHGFGLKTVAECVENQLQMDRLAEIGVDYFQGFYIEEPHKLVAA